MRIIAGKRKGAKLFALSGEHTRPTLDRVKEAVFNIIQNYFPCARVLDLFAGSGGMGIEALSRGAEFAAFVDNDRAAAEVISKNLAHTKFDGDSEVFCGDWLNFIKSTRHKFDIIFLDPPYNQGYLAKAAEAVKDYEILNSGGIIVTESAVGNDPCVVPQNTGFEIVRQKRYGKVLITVLTL